MASATHVIIRKRVTYLFLGIAVIMLGLIGRLAYLQSYQSDWLVENAREQRVRDIPVEAKRGKIFDRNGKELAISVSSESVYAIPAEIQEVDQAAAKLAAILNFDTDKLTVKLKRRQAFTWIKRRITPEQGKAVKLLNIPGVGLTEESQRYYPHENTASHVLGFTGVDSQGLDGVEISFDAYLKGRLGSIVVEYDARGREIPYAAHRFIAPVDGNDIYLTIDIVIQQIVERELEKAMQETQAKAATIIVMQPQTGEILGLANRPDYNPNQFSNFSPKLWRNIAVSNAYEPGSTFKIITTSAVLGDGVVKVNDRFFDPGSIEVQGRHIHCWKHGGHGSQSFEEVVENSCNVGFVNAGLRLHTDDFYNYLKQFGFNRLTQIDLPGEAKGIMIPQAKVKPIDIATMSIGQSIAITPIQLITAVSAVANNGKLTRPQIVREVWDKQGQKLRGFSPDVVSQAIHENTAHEVKRILEKVVENGTGRNAYIEGFRIAGKTGTAQKVGAGGYAPGKYVASFVGFAPVDNPQIAVIVIVDEPVGLYYGGQIAAPVFGAVAKDILQYLKVAPRLIDNESTQKQVHVVTPNVINLSIPDAIAELKQAGLSARVEEAGERVGDQIPKPGSMVPPDSSVLLYTLTPRYGVGEITVPDCQGRSLQEAIDILSEVGLAIKPSGNAAKATRQEPAPGFKVAPGTPITIYFE